MILELGAVTRTFAGRRVLGAITIAVALALFEGALRYTVKHGTLNQY